MLAFDAATRSWLGPRQDNQDSALATPNLIAVADGVGGKDGGAVASALVLSHLLLLLFAGSLGDLDPEALLAGAGARLRDTARLDAGLSTMSTTLVAAVIRSA